MDMVFTFILSSQNHDKRISEKVNKESSGNAALLAWTADA